MSIIKNNNNFYEIMTNQMSKYEYDFVEKTKEDYEIDKIVTKKTMIYLQNFFHNKTTADTTKKMNMYFSKKSKKSIYSYFINCIWLFFYLLELRVNFTSIYLEYIMTETIINSTVL